MNNLRLLNQGIINPESRTYPDLDLIDSVFDSITDSITFVLGSEAFGVVEVQQFMNNGTIHVLTSFPVENGSLLSFSHFTDEDLLVFVFSNGDIIAASYDRTRPDVDTTVVEIVGSIDEGLKASSWSPDEETLVLLSKSNKLILLSRDFEPINEKILNPEDIYIVDSNHVSVGWGKKETQFKGRGAKAIEREKEALKHAGLDLQQHDDLRDPTVKEVEKGYASSFDEGASLISWRGDSEYFVVSTLESAHVVDLDEMYLRRVLRVFERDGNLSSVAEAVDGLEGTLSWKPQGSLIASAQRHTDSDGLPVLDLIFYERNGLRHGNFNTRLDPLNDTLDSICWNSNSEILAFKLKNRVQLWTTKNYHWYLKQEIFVNINDPENQVEYIKFHPEKPYNFMIGTTNSSIYVISLAPSLSSGPTTKEQGVGNVMVIDGSTANITPLGIANIPPPLSFREYELDDNINDIAVSGGNDLYGCLTSSMKIFVLQLPLKDTPVPFPAVLCELNMKDHMNNDEIAKQIAFANNGTLSVCVDNASSSRILFFSLDIVKKCMSFQGDIALDTKVVSLVPNSSFKNLALQKFDGAVYCIDDDNNVHLVSKLPQLCQNFEVYSPTLDDQFNNACAVGLTINGKLFINGNQVAVGVTSFKIADNQLLFTTTNSQLCFIHLNSDSKDEMDVFKDLNKNNYDDIHSERVRQIERGSLLVSVIPSKFSVVLQAPRGNIETIYPRLLVLAEVRSNLNEKNYKDAFWICRTHRIDLDILYDYNPVQFLSNVENFINQIGEVDYLDLFLSCLKEEDTTLTKFRDTTQEFESLNSGLQNISVNEELEKDRKTTFIKRIIKNKEDHTEVKDSKISKVCKAILDVLLTTKYLHKYMQTILTAYICQKPPNMEEPLKLISTLDDSRMIENCVSHLCFLSDSYKLYQASLGLYDVQLSLLFAQKSQMDPKEYLPFLQNLHSKPELRMKFLIDDYLKRYEIALNHLHQMGEEVEPEFMSYVIKHDLFKHALSLYKYDEVKTNLVLKIYADHLFEIKNYSDSAITYEYLNIFDRALESYVLAKKWKEALAVIQRPEFTHLLEDTSLRLISLLSEEHNYNDAAFIASEFLADTEESMRLYCKGYFFEDAILLCMSKGRANLIEEIIQELISESFGTIAELLADCKGQITSQVRRLREIRDKKKVDPDAFYNRSDDLNVPDNVSVAASETSTTPSFFTRYTGKTAGTAKTGASRRTVKNRKREERKRAKGRKGTIYEEEYLIQSIGRLVERLNQTQKDASRLIEGLLRLKRREQAYQIQKNWIEVINLLKENLNEIYDLTEKDRERIDENGELYIVPEIPKPTITEFPKNNTLDY